MGRSPAGREGVRALLPIDNGPIRESAVVEVRKAMRALEKAQGEMRVFEQADKPLFRRWYHGAFAAELARLRGLEERAAELRARIAEVRQLKASYRLDFHDAWLMTEQRRERPEICHWQAAAEDVGAGDPYGSRADLFGWTGVEGDAERVGDESAEEAQLLSEDEIRELFVRFLERTTNLDPFSLEDAVYSRLLAEYKRDVLGISPEESADAQGGGDSPAASPEDLKRLYRLLVRRLHPDFHPAPADRLKDAWNRMQAAYRDGDLRELELIAALCDVDCAGVTDVSSVSRLLSMRDECRERIGILFGELAEAREDPAWGFSRAARPAGALVRSLQEDLALSTARASIGLASLERVLRRYARPPEARPRRRDDGPDQLRLPFGGAGA